MNAVYKWGWFGGANTDCGCDSLYAAYFGTGLLLSYLVRARGLQTRWHARVAEACWRHGGADAATAQLSDAFVCAVPCACAHTQQQFLFIDFFIQTYKRGVAKRRQAKADGRKKTK
jgi:hypothetical protein